MASNPLLSALGKILSFPGDLTRGQILSLLGKDSGGMATGEEFLEGLGMEDPGALASMATEVAVDPMNLLPVGMYRKAAKALKAAKANNATRSMMMAQGAMPAEVAAKTALRDAATGEPTLAMVPDFMRRGEFEGMDLNGISGGAYEMAPAFVDSANPFDTAQGFTGSQAKDLYSKLPGSMPQIRGGIMDAAARRNVTSPRGLAALPGKLESKMRERYDAARLMGMADPSELLEDARPASLDELYQALRGVGLKAGDIYQPSHRVNVPKSQIAWDTLRGRMDRAAEANPLLPEEITPTGGNVLDSAMGRMDMGPGAQRFPLEPDQLAPGTDLSTMLARNKYDSVVDGIEPGTGAPLVTPILPPSMQKNIETATNLEGTLAALKQRQRGFEQVREMLKTAGRPTTQPDQAIRALRRQIKDVESNIKSVMATSQGYMKRRVYAPQVAPELQAEQKPSALQLLGMLTGYQGLHQGAENYE